MPRPPAAGDTGIYRVQLGAFREAINAQQLITALQQNGFTPAYENHDNYYRVVLSGVSAASLQDVARRLGGMGIREMWIRREQ
ncbi:MAG: SPOR domain-containing protein [Treponema sp.]|nr:SPOR domain-containing protein [Treponema sp.]